MNPKEAGRCMLEKQSAFLFRRISLCNSGPAIAQLEENYARSAHSRSLFIHQSVAFDWLNAAVPVELWNSIFHSVTREDLLTCLKLTRQWY